MCQGVYLLTSNFIFLLEVIFSEIQPSGSLEVYHAVLKHMPKIYKKDDAKVTAEEQRTGHLVSESSSLKSTLRPKVFILRKPARLDGYLETPRDRNSKETFLSSILS